MRQAQRQKGSQSTVVIVLVVAVCILVAAVIVMGVRKPALRPASPPAVTAPAPAVVQAPVPAPVPAAVPAEPVPAAATAPEPEPAPAPAAVPAAVTAPAREAREAVLCDFESADTMRVIEGRNKVELVSEHATGGVKSGKVPAGFTIVAGGWTGLPADWSAYDELQLDVYNPGTPGNVSLWISDAGGSDYWQRHNNSLPLRTGKNTLSIPVGGLYRGEKGSGKFLDTKAIGQLVLSLPKENGEGFFLDTFRLVAGGGSVDTRLLAGFEEGEQAGAVWYIEDWPEDKPGKSEGTMVSEHVTQGAKALRLAFRENGGNITVHKIADPDWSRYDSLEIDCFNTAAAPVKIGGWFRDQVSADAGYWERHNYQTNVKPGASTIRFPLGGFYRGEKGSGKFLDTKTMHSFCISAKGVTFYLDNLRLVKGSAEVTVAGMRKFDFGPPNAACFPGFDVVNADTRYSSDRGFGWKGNLPSDARDYEQPDSLTSDWVRCQNNTFSVDVPAGDYKVYVLMDSPDYWGCMYWRNRMIDAEDTRVVNENQSAEAFLSERYFKHQDTEDLPGTDIWERYVRPHYAPKQFDATVSDGTLDLRFTGDTWGLTINAVVLFPAVAAEEGARWLDQLDSRRKDQFNTNYAEVVRPADPPPVAAGDAAFILFSRDLDHDVYYNSAPGGDPTDTQDVRINWAAVRGEYESAAFSVYPMNDCGELSLAVSDLKGPNGAVIPGSAVGKRTFRYKFKRIGGRITSAYEYLPFVLVPFETWPVPKGITRRFWLTLKVPADAAAGPYTGTVTVGLAGTSQTLPVTLEVYPFALEEPSMPIAMYGGRGPTGGDYWPDDLRQLFRIDERVEEVLRDQWDHGMTAVTPPAPGLKSISGDRAEFDFSQCDRFHALLRKIGYKLECFTYASMFRDLSADADAKCRKQYGKPLEEAIGIAYRELGRHMKEANWLPMAWALADEPLIHGVNAEDLVKVFEAHRKAAPEMQFVSEDAMGDPAHWVVIPAIDIICANSPRYKVAEAVKKAGSRYWFNNIARDRVTFGWFMQKARMEMGVEALFQWGYSTNPGNIFYDLDGFEGDSGCSFTCREGQRAMRHWETIREGADDHRYLETLLNLAKKIEQNGGAVQKQAAAQAMAFVKESMAKIDLENKSKKVYTFSELDGLKRKMAEYIRQMSNK